MIDRVDMRKKPNRQARVKALKDSWKDNNFLCHYTGIPLNETNHKNPLYLTFDHRTPRDENDIVVTMACINDMKSDMSEEEFKTVVIELAKCFEGKKFNKEILKLKHWKR